MITTMLSLNFSKLRLFLLALLVSATVIAATLFLVISMWQPLPLEAILPGADVTALFSNVTREDVRTWSDRFPELKNVPDFEDRLELGILQIPSGSRGWILSSPVKETPIPYSNGEFRNQDVILSDPHLMGMMTGNSVRLKSLDVFRELKKNAPAAAPHIYLRSDPAGASALLPYPLRPFIALSGGLLLSKAGGTSRISVFGAPANITAAVPDDVTMFSQAPDLVLAISSPAYAIDLWLASLPEIERAIRRGQLANIAHDLLGDDWSMQYDILPAMRDAAVLSWKTGTGSTPLFMLQSHAASAAGIRRQLQELHDGFKAMLTGTTVARRMFDRGFTSAVLGSDPSQVEDVKTVENGWTVRETRQKNGDRMMLSASRGREFVVSNKREWLEDVIAETPARRLPDASDSTIASGVFSVNLLRKLISGALAGQEWQWLLEDFPASRPIAWYLERNGHGLTLSLTLSGQ
ncbi:hypothetical protein HYW84_00270 [Candidatus Peregrinibacteria bacterium]|nr:hypothetical protein [Candidatus Peregrinibacteria bacterium]